MKAETAIIQRFPRKEMIANVFSVDTRTIERYASDFSDELKSKGYELLKGRRLNEFFNQVKLQDVPDINVGNKTRQLAIFDFRTFLNIGMLLVESENARVLRQTILDIVIDTINQKTGGATKYINQRDEDFLGAFLQEDDYRRQFTDALSSLPVSGSEVTDQTAGGSINRFLDAAFQSRP